MGSRPIGTRAERTFDQTLPHPFVGVADPVKGLAHPREGVNRPSVKLPRIAARLGIARQPPIEVGIA